MDVVTDLKSFLGCIPEYRTITPGPGRGEELRRNHYGFYLENEEVFVLSPGALGTKNFQMQIHCASCCDSRSHDVEKIEFVSDNLPKMLQRVSIYNQEYLDWGELLLYKATCRQCGAKIYLVIHEADWKAHLTILRSTPNGIATPSTPDGVKYYLRQAALARDAGANSACMTMYRAALEMLLYDQGYKKGEIGPKLEELEKQIKDKAAPGWAYRIEPEFMVQMKKLGNSAIHCNDGDYQKQEALDSELLAVVDFVFMELLDKIYEEPERSNRNLSKLKDAVQKMK